MEIFMNTKNIYRLLFMAMCVLCFGACSDEEKEVFEPVILSGNQVYFSQVEGESIVLTKDASSFEIEVRRSNTADALSIDVESVCSSDQYSIPTSVKFEAGSEVVALKIGYDPDEIAYDDFSEITLSISEKEGTPYGATSYTFTAGIPAPWKSLGKATYVEDIVSPWYGQPTVTYEVEIQENEEIPNVFRLVNPYGKAFPYNEDGDYDTSKDYYMEIDAQDPEGVYIKYSPSGMAWSDGEFTMWSYAGYLLEKGTAVEDIKAKGLFGTFNDGIISFPENSLLVSEANYNDGSFGVIGTGAFKVLMPGVVLADYSLELFYKGRLTNADDEDMVSVAFNFGEDIASVKLFMVEGGGEDAVAAAMVAIAEDAEGVQEFESAGLSFFPCEASGTYTVLLVGYDAAGELRAQENITVKFKSSHDFAETWKSLGTGLYTDDVVSCLFELSAVEYEVEIQESEQTPGKYRLVNPYGAIFPYNEDGDFDASKDYNIVIDASNANRVFIDQQNIGVDWGYGAMAVYSVGAFLQDDGYTPEEIEEEGVYGTLADGVITFPANGLLLLMGGESYYSNINGGTKIVLPSAVQKSAAMPTFTALNIKRAFVAKTANLKFPTKKLKGNTMFVD